MHGAAPRYLPRISHVVPAVTTAPLRMREDDFIAFPRQRRSYAEVETSLRRYEPKDGLELLAIAILERRAPEATAPAVRGAAPHRRAVARPVR